METIQVSVAQGYIDQSDLNYETHKRGTNYIAIVRFDPTQPGGLARSFFKKGSGSYRGIPEGLERGCIIEVAADYTTYGGNKNRSRTYYRIADINADYLIITPEESPKKDTLSPDEWMQKIDGLPSAKSYDLTEVPTEHIIAELHRRNIHTQENII